ncbi:MAG: hypothetical protein H6965_05185 [Chromatiaceae bacterium]|nr:hypothetical protein [Chromatiaceae bacterium]
MSSDNDQTTHNSWFFNSWKESISEIMSAGGIPQRFKSHNLIPISYAAVFPCLSAHQDTDLQKCYIEVLKLIVSSITIDELDPIDPVSLMPYSAFLSAGKSDQKGLLGFREKIPSARWLLHKDELFEWYKKRGITLVDSDPYKPAELLELKQEVATRTTHATEAKQTRTATLKEMLYPDFKRIYLETREKIGHVQISNANFMAAIQECHIAHCEKHNLGKPREFKTLANWCFSFRDRLQSETPQSVSKKAEKNPLT